jgi:hypothetical protein
MNKSHWQKLLRALTAHQVIPVVGRDLSLVATKDGPVPYHQLIARELARELGVKTDDLPADFTVDDVVCDAAGGPWTTARGTLLDVIEGIDARPAEPLLQLAKVTDFRLFVSTAYDPMLARAIELARGHPPLVLTYPAPSTGAIRDFEGRMFEKHSTIVFQLLGSPSPAGSFAWTEGETLERIHGLLHKDGPRGLLDHMAENFLLLLGLGLSDGMTRFLMRAARAEALWKDRIVTEFIADPPAEMTVFLKRFSADQSIVYSDGTAVDFVRELHHRWSEHKPAANQVGTAYEEEPERMQPGSVFICYATEDQEAAFEIADELQQQHDVEVWIDRRLKPGDRYEDVICDYIKSACAFLPIISKHTQAEAARFFRTEWTQAKKHAERLPATTPFIIPVVIDDTPLKTADHFGLTTVYTIDGHLPIELVNRLDEAQKRNRRTSRAESVA